MEHTKVTSFVFEACKNANILYYWGEMACNYLAAVYLNVNGHASHSLISLCQATAQHFERGLLSVLALCKPSHHLILSWVTKAAFRVPGVSPSLGWVGPGLGDVMSPSYRRDPSVFPGFPVLFSLTFFLPAKYCWQHDLFCFHRQWRCLTPCFLHRIPLWSAALSLGFRFCFPGWLIVPASFII